MAEMRALTPVLKTADVARTVAFYVDLLGFTVDTLWPDEAPSLCILDHGPVHLMFDTAADWDAPGSPPTLTGQLLIEIADVDALHRRIEDRVEVLWGPESFDYGRRELSIRDPDGYRLVFSQRIANPPG